MRADMAKVIVERPRVGSRASHKGKGYARRLQRCPADELPRREPIKVRSGGTKVLNEHLAPLRRFLHGCAGEPWNDVFAEICERISRNSAVQDHVRDHVPDYVALHVVLRDGVPCWGEGRLYGEPLTSGYTRQELYVCPVSGLLKRLPPRIGRHGRRKVPAPPLGEVVRLGEDRQFRWMDGAWHLIELKPFPARPWEDPGHDVVLGRPVARLTLPEVRRAYGRNVYAAAKRRLGNKEVRRLPLPLAPRPCVPIPPIRRVW
jgi:hypothetical protein